MQNRKLDRICKSRTIEFRLHGNKGNYKRMKSEEIIHIIQYREESRCKVVYRSDIEIGAML